MYRSTLESARADVYLFGDPLERLLTDVIHIPGIRGNRSRHYPTSSAEHTLPGQFEAYVAGIVLRWQRTGDSSVGGLIQDLQSMALTFTIAARRLNDAQIEINVGRLAGPHGGRKRDLVNIADVGIGVSQVLPVLVGLRVARPGQLVYIEQPELHLHPRAQVALGRIIAEAAIRGVRVVMETHSSLLVLSIQTLVAEGTLDPELVKLHWFTRGKDGFTKVTTAELDDAGAFGSWPEDFDDVLLEAQSRYLDAAEARLRRRRHA
jgi:predicted ATPase